MKIMHLMRTYGGSGGEQQLSQMFSVKNKYSDKEFFVKFFKDNEFDDLFIKRSPFLKRYTLKNIYVEPGKKWYELFIIIKFLPSLILNLIRVLNEEKPTLCITHGFQSGFLFWFFSILLKNCNWIYFHRTSKEKKNLFFFKLFFLPASLVIGNSRSVSKSLKYFVNERKVITLNNGIDIKTFDKSLKEKKINFQIDFNKTNLVCVGRLLPKKGHIVLLNVLSNLIINDKNIMLYIVGTGEMLNPIKKHIIDLGIQNYVTILGKREDVPYILSLMTIFVNCSVNEGMSNAVLEAMAARLPSVVVDAPGVSECHIKNVTGFVVANNTHKLATKIKKLIDDLYLRKKMGNNARKRIEDFFSIELNRQKYTTLYQKWTH